MFLRSSFPPQRSGINRIEVAVLGNLLLLTIALLLPACQRHIDGGSRTQSINNLRQITLCMASFHDVNKRLPFNGTVEAVAKDATTGSWAFQILPYIDQAPLFNDLKMKDAATHGVQAYMSPARGRQSYEEGKGAWTDYFINNYLNDPANADRPDNADQKRTMLSITDGVANTIFAGEGNIATTDYVKTKDVPGSSNIFAGGTQGTMRAGPNWQKGTPTKVALQRDSSRPTDLVAGGWGGPYPQGGLMGMGDGTVRMFPYSTAAETFGAFLTPTGNEKVELPD